jgi:hypothetical protein
MLATLGVAIASAIVPHLFHNIWPWVVMQFGGIAVVLVCAFRSLNPHRLGISFPLVIGFYALAKVFEMNDSAIFELTGGVLSGHSLKHLIACFAVVPVLKAWASNTPAVGHPQLNF